MSLITGLSFDYLVGLDAELLATYADVLNEIAREQR